jgi:multiple sugar transport system permease protein
MVEEQNLSQTQVINSPRTTSARLRTRFFPHLSALEWRTAGWGVLFCLPLIIGLIVFVYGPVLMALGLSFTDYDAINPPQWIGLGNFEYLLTWDFFRTAFSNTAYMVIGFVAICTPLSLGLALLLNQKVRGVVVFRSAFFLPVIISMISAGLLWKWLYLPDFGALNWFLSFFGIPPIPWVTEQAWAIPAIIFMSVWKAAGYFAIIFLAALQSVPHEYYEAAKIDGASRMQSFLHITLPLISPTTFFVVVTMIIGSAQVFDQIWVITKGGPAYGTLSIVMLVYRTGFELLQFGRASAVTVVFFLIIMAVTILQFRFQRQWVHYD